MSKIEGGSGTWFHCTNRDPHPPHRHLIVFPKGPYPGVQCSGVVDPAPVEDRTAHLTQLAEDWRATDSRVAALVREASALRSEAHAAFLRLRAALAESAGIPILEEAAVDLYCADSPAQIHLYDVRDTSDTCVFCKGRLV